MRSADSGLHWLILMVISEQLSFHLHSSHFEGKINGKLQNRDIS